MGLEFHDIGLAMISQASHQNPGNEGKNKEVAWRQTKQLLHRT